MGRRAKTIRQHLLHGSVPQGKPEKPSAYVGGRPKIPSHLSPAARSEFKRACKILLDRGTATAGDFATLAIYAEVYSRWIAAKEEVRKQGLMIQTTLTDNNGIARTVSRVNPLLKVSAECERTLLRLAGVLGLTPVDREKVKQTQANPQEEVIPGSIADLHPELVGGTAKASKVRVLTPEELAASEFEEANSGDEGLR